MNKTEIRDKTSSRHIFASWDEADTFDKILEYTKQFIEGELKSTPYYSKSLCVDSTPLIPDLLEMNRLRLLTTDGQGGIPLTEKGAQKAYVGFHMDKNSYNDAFLRRIMRDPNLIWIILDNERDELDDLRGEYKKRCFRNTFVSNYCVTLNGDEGCTRAYIDSIDMLSFNSEAISSLKYWSVFVCYDEWGKQGLEKHLISLYHGGAQEKNEMLNIMKKCGIEDCKNDGVSSRCDNCDRVFCDDCWEEKMEMDVGSCTYCHFELCRPCGKNHDCSNNREDEE